ncbi:hypothetical protein FHS91_000718 [Sphingobium xanthum]|uniref:intermembrane phospholipid transport protein YdbH family protein n=1 Tax=Sphingobium xanthum TaxID=1387165 RepID=UPI001C8CA1D8|nr:YdbH domain-containing protein [Sphingobium xanthum]
MAEDAEVLEEQAGRRSRRLGRAKRIGGGVAIVLALAAGALWLARKPIADTFIARELAARGVQGRYTVTRIGPRTQRLDNLVIGNPARPDVTVRFVEIDVGWGLNGARITRVQASGVRLRGRLREDGVLDLGQLNRLIEGGEGEAALPQWTVDVDDARADIATGYGPLVLVLQGRGYLPSGFAGTLGLAATSLRYADCRIAGLKAPLDVATENERIVLKGPVSTPSVVCPESGFALAMPKIDVNLRTDLALEDIGGALSFFADGAEQGERRVERLSGLVTFSGKAEELRGSASISASGASIDGVLTDAAKIGGNFALNPTGRNRAVAWQGLATIDNARPADGIDLRRIMSAASDTPVAPLAEKLAQAIERIGKANRLTIGGDLNLLGTRGNAQVNRLELASASGARVRAIAGTGVKYSWPDGALQASGALEMVGGGLPEGRIDFAADERGAVNGTARLAAYSAGTARLAFAPARFRIEPSGQVQLSTVLTLDGPLPDGALRGLTVPLDARMRSDGAIALAGDCAPVRWASLRLSSLSLDPAQLRLCGISGGQLRLGQTRLTGRMGTSPLVFTADFVRYGLANGRFDLVRPDVRIGAAEAPVRIAASKLEGAIGAMAGGIGGTLEGGTARIETVPLDLTQIGGRWTFANGRLMVDGGLRVSDTAPAARFNPLTGQGVQLTLANNRIDATGVLVHPARQVPVASVVIRHELSSGAGQADLKVDSLRFGGAIQPDDLTPLALGVIANVDGPVEGTGQIRWTGTDVTSTGTFSTRGMSFAAAFGPVSGFATTIKFADLLGLRTEPGQVMTIGSVNPGVDVRDGTIRYALRSNEQAVIEGGSWPFSGGTLELLPATLDLDARKPRHLSFRVVGLEAGAFINTLELDNISATGTFDGLLPMVFDEHGGRIEGGVLVARQQGNAPLVLTTTQGLNVPCDPVRQSGNLAYVGEVSNAQLGAFGKLAFDALKNLRYRCLAIMLDGALDGEFVTRITVNGINQGTEEARRSFLARPFIGLPFIFNVRIEAPFRGLLNTAASFSDPSAVIRNQLGDRYAPVITDTGRLAVQPTDSDKRIEGVQK